MSDPTTVHNTFVVEHSYAKPPARVFAAFADPALKQRWYAEGKTHVMEVYEMDFRVGGPAFQLWIPSSGSRMGKSYRRKPESAASRV